MVDVTSSTDYDEYYNAIFKDSYGHLVDAEPAHTLQLNLRPEMTLSLQIFESKIIYATFGKSIAQPLSAVSDPEKTRVYTEVRNIGDNYKLNLWVNEAQTYLYSEQLRE